MAEQPDPLSAPWSAGPAPPCWPPWTCPRTTTQLAAELGLSQAAVSQHLKILHNTALVTAQRRGRMVLYQRTPAATTLLATIPTDQATG